jgi:hypothetical protein
VLDLPDTPFADWTLEEVEACAADELFHEMAGTRRHVLGPRRKLLEAMRKAGVRRFGDLRPDEPARHYFVLVTMRGKPGWPEQ